MQKLQKVRVNKDGWYGSHYWSEGEIVHIPIEYTKQYKHLEIILENSKTTKGK